MSDRIVVPVLRATARGPAYRSSFRGETRETSDGRPLWTVVAVMEIPSRWRPIPEAVEYEIEVPGPVPDIADGDELEFVSPLIRAGVRKGGTAYLAVTAQEVRL